MNRPERKALRAGSHAYPVPQQRPLQIAVLILGMVVGALGMRLLGPGQSSQPARSVAVEPAASGTTAHAEAKVERRSGSETKREKQAVRGVPTAVLCPVEDREREREYQEKESEQLVGRLLQRLDIFEEAMPAAPAEAIVDRNQMYQMGFVDGLAHAAPNLSAHIADQVEKRLCDSNTKQTHIMSMARLMNDMPDLATERGFECAIANRTSEDMALWTLLDAWRQSGMPSSPAIDRLASTATDQRTLRRLATGQDSPLPAGVHDLRSPPGAR